MNDNEKPGQASEGQTMTIDQAISLAVEHQNAGRLQEAENIYNQVLKAIPDHPIVTQLLGVLAYQVGKVELAVDYISKAIALKPDYAEAHYNLGKALKDLGRMDEAVASYFKALAFNPNDPDTHYNLANTLKDMERFEDAIVSYRNALSINPQFAQAHSNLGIVFKELGKLNEAVECYNQALAILPDYAEAHSNLGLAQQDLGQQDEAIESYRKALSINPQFAEVHSNLGLALQDKGQVDEAMECYFRALEIKPDHAQAHNNLGLAYQELGQMDQAAQKYNTAITFAPESAEPHNNLGLFQLLMGDFENGWKNCAWRWQTNEPPAKPRQYDAPFWDGGELIGKTIFIYPEQGLGDTIQFARYLPMLEAAGAQVIFEIPEVLRRFFENSDFSKYLLKANEKPQHFDCHAPLLDVPQFLQTALDTIPVQESWYEAESALVEQWAERFSGPKNFRVGIVWAGNPKHKNDRNRSIDAALLKPLTQIPDVSLFSLQVGKNGEANQVFGDTVTDLSPYFKNFADTAAALSHLDLVVSVDTSIVHLAGSLGRPVWTLLPFIPDWRWLMEREDSPWYPSMRLFRQQARGDWNGVIESVCSALREKIQVQNQ